MATYYVSSSDGNDSDTGLTEALAWSTIAKVIAYDKATGFQPGDNIAFKKGDTWREQLQSWNSGIVGSPITYTSYGTGAEPIIDGSDVVTGWTDEEDGTWSKVVNPTAGVWEDNVRLTYKDYENSETITAAGQWGYVVATGKVLVRCTDDAAPSTHTMEVGARNVSCWLSHNNGTFAKANNAYVILENITFQKAAGLYSALTGGGTMIDSDGDYLNYQIMVSEGNHIIVRNLITRQCGKARPYNGSEAVLATVWSANIEFWHAPYSEMYGVTAYDGSTVLLNMETLANVGEYYTMYNCIAYDAEHIGIMFNGGSCYNNTVSDIRGTGVARGTGLSINPNIQITTNIYNNSVSDCVYGVYAYAGGHATYDTFFYNNMFLDCTGYGVYLATGTLNYKFYHNLFTTAGSGNGVFVGSDNVTVNDDIDFKNNIIYVLDGYAFQKDSTGDVVTQDYNLYYRVSAGNLMNICYTPWNYAIAAFADYKTKVAPQDANSLTTDPLLTSDYHLSPGSPCIDAGVDVGITTDYEGHLRKSTPDIGAYESFWVMISRTIRLT